MATNFDLAPPVKTVDGLVAVPIDIQTISASLACDGATSTGSGDATLEFTMGPSGGNPIFDLRQTITAAWLDGVAIPVADVAHHDFGGGPNAELRIVESVLAAGSTHTLRVTYTLGIPQAATNGSYQPSMTFSAGPRLVFNFGFTDLGAGRYLESWVPANLIYDQFELDLTLRITNTAVAHTVITNGTVTTIAANHWSVAFPARFTALSPLLELRATDTVTSATGTVTLPVSGATITIEAWKRSANSINLNTQIASLQTFLADNESAIGPYIHGNRFVAFMNIGGMEYEGGTTTGAGALKHETFHSWWARGLKPASQPDAWWDEAWTTYYDFGAASAVAFDFSDAPKELCPRNPWIRITADGAYDDGNRFFEGAASLLGVATLKSLMRDFYEERKGRPETTAHLEEYLVARSGNPDLVDAFHRFVYGFANPASAPDLWIRDDPGHTGADEWGGTFWDSPDLWIRNEDDDETIHQEPEFGQDNWFYARVRNRSTTVTAQHFLVTFNVKTFAGTQFQYPSDFLPCIAAAAGFDLAPGASTIVKARWPSAMVPPEGTHACWLAAVLTRSDHPTASKHVWEHNNLAQKNLTVVDLEPGDWFILPFVLKNLKFRWDRYFLDILRPKGFPELETSLLVRSEKAFKADRGRDVKPFRLPAIDRRDLKGIPTDCGSALLTAAEAARGILTSRTIAKRGPGQFAESIEIPFEEGRTARVPMSLRGGDQIVAGLRLQVPDGAKRGDVLRADLVQRDSGGKNILGGIAVEIRVR